MVSNRSLRIQSLAPIEREREPLDEGQSHLLAAVDDESYVREVALLERRMSEEPALRFTSSISSPNA